LLALFSGEPTLAASQSAAGLRIEEVEFLSRGTKLSGTLVLPRNGKIHAAVVFIHGSGKQGRNLQWARRFASTGIAALVYDKRGAGRSGGEYEGNQSVSEANISLLADDADAALRHLAQHASLKTVPLGLAGISQAGWIAPLSAQRSRLAKFLVLWSAPVCKVSEEDIYSKYTRDAGGTTVPSYRQALESRTEKYLWPDFLGRDTDSSEDLARLSIPGLWIFSDNDASIPVDLSIARLETLKAAGHAYEYVLVPGLGHDNMDGTFGIATEWIRRGGRNQAVPGGKASRKNPATASAERAMRVGSS
jgi:pimeloyl-ACP methyl ester carboxylesterase